MRAVIKGIFQLAFEGVKAIWSPLSPFFSDLWKAIKVVVSTVWAGIVAMFRAYYNVIIMSCVFLNTLI